MDMLQQAQNIIFSQSDLSTDFSLKLLQKLSCRTIDFGDIFFERSVSEVFSLEEGIVKSGSFDISLGAGIRAVTGNKTGFAYSDVLDRRSLEEAATAARSISAGHNCKMVCVRPKILTAKPLYDASDPIKAMPRAQKVAILKTVDQCVRAQDPRIIQVMASLSCLHRVSICISTTGQISCDIKPIVSLAISAIAQQGNRRENGFAASGGAFMLNDLIDGGKIEWLSKEAARTALLNLEAIPTPAGNMPVVLGAGWPGVLIHEAVGHGLEGDFNRTGSSAFSGLIGTKVASEHCTIIDDGTIPKRRGSYAFDDEGTPSGHNVLIERGVLKGYMQDRQNAMLMGMQPTGNGRRESYNCLPLPRMTNTYMMNGSYSKDELISSVKKGIYAVNFSGGQVDITSGKFVFSTSEAYLIENGKITCPIKGATLIGNGPETMKKVSMVADDLKFDDGIGTCGKAGQSVPVGIGQPTLKLDSITIGGTSA